MACAGRDCWFKAHRLHTSLHKCLRVPAKESRWLASLHECSQAPETGSGWLASPFPLRRGLSRQASPASHFPLQATCKHQQRGVGGQLPSARANSREQVACTGSPPQEGLLRQASPASRLPLRVLTSTCNREWVAHFLPHVSMVGSRWLAPAVSLRRGTAGQALLVSCFPPWVLVSWNDSS